MNYGFWIIVALAAYFGLLMLISVIIGKQKGNEAFFTGNKKSPWYIVAIGMIGNSISGVSFVSVPGMVRENGFLYMQTVVGFFFGYILIAKVLLPLYYKLESPSIYAYLNQRFGRSAYKTGAWFFLISKGVGAAARIYVVAIILQTLVFNEIRIPFTVTATILIFIIWLYTFRTGIKTIVWTDVIQTIFMVAALIMIIVEFGRQLNLNMAGIWNTTISGPWFKLTEFSDWHSKQHFVKQFLSGIFIALVMTGLDQDMIQKNRTIKRLDKAQKNMYYYGFAFIPINFMFLTLGALMLTFASIKGISLPSSSDAILPMLATGNYFNTFFTILFTVGIVSATFSGADSAMTSMTTSFCVDIAGKKDDERFRKLVHVGVAILFVIIMLVFRAVNDRTLIDAIYVIASYTYGPLLGLYSFGLISKRNVSDKYIPYISVVSPVFCYILQLVSEHCFGYSFGYELLMINGLLTLIGLWSVSSKKTTIMKKINIIR
jgi:Na+/proline symporter